MVNLHEAQRQRKPDHNIEDLFVGRWSPRAMSGDSLDRESALRLFEAARWAPSTYNEQEWRFLFAMRGTPEFSTFLELLAEPNKAWAGDAAMLGVVCSHSRFEKTGEPNAVNVFDSGLAFMNLALQGAAMGLVVHGMQGFDFAAARRELRVPEDYNINAMFAVGRPGDPADLPEQFRDKESPSGRKPVDEIILEGGFPPPRADR